jgi:hypothetical protein
LNPVFPSVVPGHTRGITVYVVIKTTGGLRVVTPADKSVPLGRWNGGFPWRTTDSNTHLVTPSGEVTEIIVNEKQRKIVLA